MVTSLQMIQICHNFSNCIDYHWVQFKMVRRSLIARFMGLTWGPSGADRTQVGPMSAPWTLLSGIIFSSFHCILVGGSRSCLPGLVNSCICLKISALHYTDTFCRHLQIQNRTHNSCNRKYYDNTTLIKVKYTCIWHINKWYIPPLFNYHFQTTFIIPSTHPPSSWYVMCFVSKYSDWCYDWLMLWLQYCMK